MKHFFFLLCCLMPGISLAQLTKADYQRADTILKLENHVYSPGVRPNWLRNSHYFWYQNREKTVVLSSSSSINGGISVISLVKSMLRMARLPILLMKANKNFDQLYLPGKGHSLGGAFEMHKIHDFFVESLLGQEAPEW